MTLSFIFPHPPEDEKKKRFELYFSSKYTSFPSLPFLIFLVCIRTTSRHLDAGWRCTG